MLKNNCFKVVDDFGQSYLILWPYGFSYVPKQGKIAILDKDRNVLVFVGDNIRLSGGEILNAEFEKHNPGIVQKECVGQYWLSGSLVERLE
jgi:hypothetical protein